MSLNHRWCVGVDLHKDTLTACVFCGCCGEVSFQKIACRCRRQIAEYFAALPRPHAVAIESVGFYRWLWEMLEPIVEELVLADATQARALAGRRLKTDREDALNIAQLLSAGRLPDELRSADRGADPARPHAPPQRLLAAARPHPAPREVDHERQQPAWPGADAKRRADPLPQGPRREASGAARRDALAVRRSAWRSPSGRWPRRNEPSVNWCGGIRSVRSMEF